MNWTIDIVRELEKKGKIRGYVMNSKLPSQIPTSGKKSKYGNEKVEVNGILFDSWREAKRWSELLILLKAGEIGLLERQVEFELNEGGTHSLKYIADFRYFDYKTEQTVVEDAKGFKTREYRKKARLMKKLFGITIREV